MFLLGHVVLGVVAVLAATSVRAADRAVIIVAGQSNALNWHAAAAALPPGPRDAEIPFYHETGAPPERGGAVPFNSTSRGRWIALGPQRQDPYVRYERDFFGPEIPLARSLQRNAALPLAVIKVAYFGSSLAVDWQPGSTRGNRLHERLHTHVNAALDGLRQRGDQPRIAGFFWMQGETDGASAAHATAYAANLASFIARVRSDSNMPTLPFVLGRVGPPPPKGYAHQAVVRAAQVRAAETVPAVAWVDTDDLPRDTDGIHLLAAGVLMLGERMAAAWQRLSTLVSRP